MPKSLQKLQEEATALGISFTGEESATALDIMIKEQSAPADAPAAPVAKQNVTFTEEQLAVINEMMNKVVSETKTSSPNSPISLYNLRDPKTIETVNVRRFEGKFVVGFANHQNDPFKKTPKYNYNGVDPVRKLPNEPYVTLLLSTDGETIDKRDVLLVDYLNERELFVAKVLDVKKKEVINDHGILGRVGGDYGIAVDSKGIPESRPTIAAQSKTIELSFVVQLPGFKTTTEFISDFLA